MVLGGFFKGLPRHGEINRGNDKEMSKLWKEDPTYSKHKQNITNNVSCASRTHYCYSGFLARYHCDMAHTKRKDWRLDL